MVSAGLEFSAFLPQLPKVLASQACATTPSSRQGAPSYQEKQRTLRQPQQPHSIPHGADDDLGEPLPVDSSIISGRQGQ